MPGNPNASHYDPIKTESPCCFCTTQKPILEVLEQIYSVDIYFICPFEVARQILWNVVIDDRPGDAAVGILYIIMGGMGWLY